MIIEQNRGRLFEKSIHSFLQKTNLDVLSEKEVKRKYGIDTTAIDHLIELDSYILCFQDKYENCNPSISKINHFIQCVTNVHNRSKKICIGIYLSKMPLSANSLEAFNMNNISSQNIFISINNSNEESIIYDLVTLLYSNNIFLYEEDGSCIMLY
jgi:hypothetical protein